jgi:hypothetical protein
MEFDIEIAKPVIIPMMAIATIISSNENPVLSLRF